MITVQTKKPFYYTLALVWVLILLLILMGHFLVGCLDTLAAMQELKMGVASAEEETQAVMKVYSKEDYSVVNRFESE